MAAKKRELTQEEIFECSELKDIFEEKKAVLGLTQALAAEKLGMSQSAVNHYLNGTNALNASVASQFAKLLQVPISNFSHRLAKEINMMAIGIDVEKLKSIHPGYSIDTTTLRVMDVAASCGNGVLNAEYPELLRSLEIPNSALVDLLGTSDLRGVELMAPDGDSMAPTIPRKSITLIKTNITEFENSGVYLIDFDDYTYIKRLSRGKHGVIHVTSDNPSYVHSNFQVRPEEREQLIIRGKFWKALPLEFLDI